MPVQTDNTLRTYYTTVLAMLKRVTRQAKGPRRPGVRTSDVVQEVFLRIAPQLRAGESVESLIPLAATVSRRWLIDSVRRRHTVPIPADIIDGAERSLRGEGIEILDLNEFLEGLEPSGRAIVDLRIFAGLELEEIRTLSGETEHFIRKTLQHAKRELQRLRDAD